jgi:hypothetical protein
MVNEGNEETAAASLLQFLSTALLKKQALGFVQ